MRTHASAALAESVAPGTGGAALRLGTSLRSPKSACGLKPPAGADGVTFRPGGAAAAEGAEADSQPADLHGAGRAALVAVRALLRWRACRVRHCSDKRLLSLRTERFFVWRHPEEGLHLCMALGAWLGSLVAHFQGSALAGWALPC